MLFILVTLLDFLMSGRYSWAQRILRLLGFVLGVLAYGVHTLVDVEIWLYLPHGHLLIYWLDLQKIGVLVIILTHQILLEWLIV